MKIHICKIIKVNKAGMAIMRITTIYYYDTSMELTSCLFLKAKGLNENGEYKSRKNTANIVLQQRTKKKLPGESWNTRRYHETERRQWTQTRSKRKMKILNPRVS